jgi:hypothetical protein
MAIAMELDYEVAYDLLAEAASKTKHNGKKHPRSARNGVPMKAVHHVFEEVCGWTWVPTMKIGSGTKVHMCEDELPSGRIIVRLSKHLAAVIDGVVHDLFDPSRDGTRAVYGYWYKSLT